jgi:hypothetical protein
MKLLLFFSLFIGYISCTPTFQMTPPAHITKNYHLFDFYSEYGSDADVEMIAHHYLTQEDQSDAFGHILVDFDNYEVPIYVYQDLRNRLYWFKLNPENGEEYQVYLTKEQMLHVWSFN